MQLYAVVADYFFLAVIIAHRYTAFPTLTVDLTVFVTWADLTPLSLRLALCVSLLWLSCGSCAPTPSHCFSDRGFAVGGNFPVVFSCVV